MGGIVGWRRQRSCQWFLPLAAPTSWAIRKSLAGPLPSPSQGDLSRTGARLLTLIAYTILCRSNFVAKGGCR